MTEAEWLVCNDPYSLLKYLGTNISARKFRYFGSACCRRIWKLLESDDTRRVVEVAEQFADGHILQDQLGVAWNDAYCNLVSDGDADAAYNLGWGGIIRNQRIFANSINDPHFGIWFYASDLAASAAETVARSNGGISCLEELPLDCRDENGALRVDQYKRTYRQEEDYQKHLIRCIFGNPFHTALLDPRWLTSTVVDLAQAVYNERAFDRLPILADALMDAGCDSEDIIAHCRGDGPHVRGCWVVDLILAKN